MSETNNLIVKVLYENQINTIYNMIEEVEQKLREVKINLKYELKNCEITLETNKQFTQKEWQYLHNTYRKIDKHIECIKHIENEINKLIEE